MRYLRYFKINESIVNKVDIDYYFDIQYKFGVSDFTQDEISKIKLVSGCTLISIPVVGELSRNKKYMSVHGSKIVIYSNIPKISSIIYHIKKINDGWYTFAKYIKHTNESENEFYTIDDDFNELLKLIKISI